MGIGAAVERRTIKEALPALGKLTMWLWAWGLMMLLTLFVRAIFGTLTGSVGWFPFAGKVITAPIHKIEQKVSNYIGGAVSNIDAHIATSWHNLAGAVRGIPSALVDDAGLIFGLAAALVVLPSYALVRFLIHAGTMSIHAAERELDRLLGGARKGLLGLGHFVKGSIWARVVALAALVSAIAHELPHLRTRERALEQDIARLRDWLRHRKLSLTTGAFLGAFVWALGKLGIGWVRCTRNKGLMKDLACSPKGDYLLSILEGGLLLLSAFSIVEFAKVMQGLVGAMDDAFMFGISEFKQLAHDDLGVSGKTPAYPRA